MKKPLIPSLLIAETYFPVKDEKGFTASIIEQASMEGFYRSFEIGDIQDQEERTRIRKIKESNQVVITEWLTFLIDRKHLDVSSLDQTLRLNTVNQIRENIYLAAECGATNIAFITGPDPGLDRRNECIEGLFESLCMICEEAEKYHINVLIEHLDRIAHKKRVIGPIDEAVKLLSRVKETYKNIGLAFDTAHAALNGEDIIEALKLGKNHIHQIHFSNAVLDPTSELYGDHHMPIGKPGFLTSEKIVEILREVEQIGIETEDGLRVAIESRTLNKEVLDESTKYTKELLKNSLHLVTSK